MSKSLRATPYFLFFALLSSVAPASVFDCKNLLKELPIAGLAARIETKAAELKAKGQLASPVTWRAETAEFGLPGLDLPAELGGAELSVAHMASLFEFAGQFGLDMRDAVGAGHARLLMQSPNPEVREVARKAARGEAYVAIAITEAQAGSDFHSMQSVAEPAEGGFLLSGSKLFNARLNNATHVILFTRSPEGKGLSAFLVPLNQSSLDVVDLEAHGLFGNSFGGLNFDRLFVPSHMAIGGEASGGKLFRQHFLYWRLMMAAAAVGTGRGALEQVADRLRTREVFGGPIGRFTHLQQPLGEHTTKLLMAHYFIQEAAKKIDAGAFDEATVLVAGAKAEGVESALAAADFAMRTFGAEGYSTRVDLGQRVIDLMGLRIADGTTDVLRSDIVRKVYGADLWDMALGGSRISGMPPAAGAAPDFLAGAAGGGGPPKRVWPDPAAVLTQLQAARSEGSSTPVLAQQKDYDGLIRPGGGGACPMAQAFNILQLLHAYESPGDYLSPHAVIADAYAALPQLLNGRVNNAQFLRLMEYLKKKYLVRTGLGIQIETAPRTVGKIKDPRPNEIQGYMYDIFAEDGTFIGRHFVLLKNKSGTQITTVEPQNTAKDFRYELEDGGGPEQTRVQLMNPASAKYTRYLESILTLTLH